MINYIVTDKRRYKNVCRYVTPMDAGYSTEFVEESLVDHIYPTGRSPEIILQKKEIILVFLPPASKSVHSTMQTSI